MTGLPSMPWLSQEQRQKVWVIAVENVLNRLLVEGIVSHGGHRFKLIEVDAKARPV